MVVVKGESAAPGIQTLPFKLVGRVVTLLITGRWYGVAIPQGGAICHMLTTGGIIRTNLD